MLEVLISYNVLNFWNNLIFVKDETFEIWKVLKRFKVLIGSIKIL